MPPRSLSTCLHCGGDFDPGKHESRHCSVLCARRARVRSADDIARYFWRRVEKTPDGCWRWLLGVDKDGYGLWGYKGRRYRAHRLAWTLASGTVPDGRSRRDA